MAEQNFLEQDAGDDDNPFLDDDLFPTAEPDQVNEPQEPALTQEQLQRLQQQAAIVERFNSDPAFARQILQQRAQQLGLQIQEPQRQEVKPQGPPADYVETVKQSLSPEMQFLAPQIAAATWTATQGATEPLRRQQEAIQQQQMAQTYDAMAQQLTAEAPGWEQYEDEMLSILGFLRGALEGKGPMTHQKYGSALKLLYRMATADAQATANAGRRMQQALRSGTRTSAGGTRSNGPDLDTMISNAKTPQQKWQLAFNHALREHGVR